MLFQPVILTIIPISKYQLIINNIETNYKFTIIVSVHFVIALYPND